MWDLSKNFIQTNFSHFLSYFNDSDGKESACNVRDLGLIPGWGKSPGEGNGNPLQYSCLENPRDWGYSSCGCKELDMTERLTLSHFQNDLSPMTLVPQFENRLNWLFFFEQIKQRWKQHHTIQSHLPVRILSYLLYSTSQRGDFLVVQWLRVLLPMQHVWVRPLVRKWRSYTPQAN